MSILKQLVHACPPALRLARKIKEAKRHDPLVQSLHQKLFERGRLTLPKISPDEFVADGGAVNIPLLHPLFAGEDAPLIDLLFLLGFARTRAPRRILEVGTYRARTTWALHLNCAEAEIVSYDIQVLPSAYRMRLEKIPRVQLRHRSFTDSREILLKESAYDFIFIDGAHDVRSVERDSALAFEILARGGAIVWHDYRYNGYATDELRVPEALDVISRERPILHVSGTTCAVYVSELSSSH